MASSTPPPRVRRPVFLDLTKIRMPVGALTSIGHRLSGGNINRGCSARCRCHVSKLYVLAMSIRDEPSFVYVASLLRLVAVKAALVILIWAFSHHVLAGVRHLLSDFDIGSPLRTARRSAWLVNLAGAALAVLAAVVLL